MAKTSRQEQEIIDFAAWSKAAKKITVNCSLIPLNPTRLTACEGFDENALVKYWSRRDELLRQQNSITAWARGQGREKAEIAAARSLWASIQFYVVILSSLIDRTVLAIEVDHIAQKPLFDISKIREGGRRYVTN